MSSFIVDLGSLFNRSFSRSLSQSESAKETDVSNSLRSSNESVRTAGPLACPAPTHQRSADAIQINESFFSRKESGGRTLLILW